MLCTVWVPQQQHSWVQAMRPCMRAIKHCVRTLHSYDTQTQKQQLRMLAPQDLRVTYPEGSRFLNEQHFFQLGVQQWLAKPPRPLTLAEMALYARHMSKQKVLQSANHVVEELQIRFAHRIRQMQLAPYLFMSHPALLDTYEQYLDSFERLRQIGKINTLADNEKLLALGRYLLEQHTRVVTNVICGVREIARNIAGDVNAANSLDLLARSLVTSRLSRRVLVKHHTALTRHWENTAALTEAERSTPKIGDVRFDCRIADVLPSVERRAKENLARVFGIAESEMPPIVLEGDEENTHATFLYLLPHFEFAFGELVYNSLEACLRTGVRDQPVIVTVSATPDTIMVRISDRGGGIDADKIPELWSLATPYADAPSLTPTRLANHQFFSLLFPVDEVAKDSKFDGTDGEEVAVGADLAEPDSRHYGLGLALSKQYVEYWGGALELHSLDGFGCDALLRISRTGNNRENLRLV